MARLPLKRLPGWQVADPNQDLRGLKVLDEDGNEVGTVADLIVNTLTDAADGVVLDNGLAYWLRDLQPANGTVQLIHRHKPSA